MGKISTNRFCIVNFTGFRQNWGCQSTSWELLKWINHTIGSDPLPEFSYAPLMPVVDVDSDLNEMVPEIQQAIIAVAEERPDWRNASVFLERLCHERYGWWAEEVKRSDVVFFQGEGTWMGSTHFHYGARLLLLPFVAKTIWSKPVLSLNQSIFICDEALKRAAVAAYNRFDANFIRESASFQFARSIGMKKLCYVPDAAFLTIASDHESLPRFEADRGYFAVTGTAYRQKGGLELIFAAAEKIKRETGLVPVVAASKDKKLEALAHDNWGANGFLSISDQTPYQAVAEAFRNCQFLLGGRYHMAIMAATVATPSILVHGNSFKNEGLAPMLDSHWPVHSLDDTNGILAQAKSIIDEGANCRARTKAAADNLRHILQDGSRAVSAWLSGKDIRFEDFADPFSFNMPATTVEAYCAAATLGLGKRRAPKADTDEALFGAIASLEERIRPLVAGLHEDRARCIAAIHQMIRSRPEEAISLPAVLREKIEAAIAKE